MVINTLKIVFRVGFNTCSKNYPDFSDKKAKYTLNKQGFDIANFFR